MTTETKVIEATGTTDDGTIEFRFEFKSTHLYLITKSIAKGTKNLEREKSKFVHYKTIKTVELNHQADDVGDFCVGYASYMKDEKMLIGLIDEKLGLGVSDYDKAKEIYAELQARVVRAHATNGQ